MIQRRTFLRNIAVGFPFLVLGCRRQVDPVARDPLVDYYTCGMHPSVRSQNPSDKCPICGMDLVPVYKKGAPGAQPAVAGAGAAETEVTNPFQVAPDRLQAIGVQSDLVKKVHLERPLRAPAIVEINEAGLRDINVKSAGYLLKLYANYVGKWVNKGDPLMTVLSEDWIGAQVDYIKSYRAYRRSTQSEAQNRNSFVVDNEIERMRQRIRVWDLSEEQIVQLEKFAMEVSEIDLRTGKGLKGTFDVLSPITGHVQVRTAVEGMRFEAGQSLLQLVDLSTVWITAEFPEDQSPYLTFGAEMSLRFLSLSGEVFKSKVDFVYPHLMEETRRQKVRLILQNPDHRLRPGMYGTVEGQMDLGEKLALPVSAVIPTGERYVVFLDHGGGKLEPRIVQLGGKQGDFYEVLSGVTEQDRVITSANFLIDAESRIQGALKTWGDSHAE